MGKQHSTPQQDQQSQQGQDSGLVQGDQMGQGSATGPDNSFMQEQLQIQNMKMEANQTVGNWYTETLHLVDADVTNIRAASERYISFDEGGTAQFKAVLGAVGAIVGLATFGTAGAVIALGCALLGVVADVSGGASGKIAALATETKQRRDGADKDAKTRRDAIQKQISDATTVESLQSIQKQASKLPAVEEVDENILYREMLLARAESGGNNISGSQWNVDNMSLWGDAPWYQSWDWGSPGWVNGVDIAEELNTLAESDPSTRKNVNINPP